MVTNPPRRLWIPAYAPRDMLTGKDLRKNWGKYVDHFFLDETDPEGAVPWSMEDSLYYIEQHPDLLFTVYEYSPVSLPVH